MKTILRGIALFPILFIVYSCTTQYGTDTVENLRTFAKIYGYIRYFHPSDEASEIDWHQFLVYGVNKIRKVQNQEELILTLDSLFAPIAPTVKIHAGVKQEHNKSELIDPTSEQAEVFWQHKGYGLTNWEYAGLYKSSRIGRTDISQNPYTFGSQVLKETNCKDKIIRLSVRARSLLDNESYAIFSLGTWSTSARKENTYTTDTITYSPNWETFESIDTIKTDTDYNWLDIKLIGSGKFEFDDFRIDLKEWIGWKPVEIENSSFDDVGSKVPFWDFGTYGYQWEVVRSDDNNYLKLEASSDFIPGSLFMERPERGQIISKEVGNGLICDFPISPILEKDPPKEFDETFNNLTSKLKFFWEKGKSEPINSRISSIIETWNILQHFYPYFDVVDTDWDMVLTDALIESIENENRRDQYKTLSRMIAKLQDGHGRVWHRMLNSRKTIPLDVAWIEDRVVVTDSDLEGIKAGDEVLEVDGVSSLERLNQIKRLKSGSDQWITYLATREFFWGNALDTLDLVIQGKTGKLKLETIRSKNISYQKEGSKTIYEVKPGIYYVNLDVTPMQQIEDSINSIIDAKGVIFDLRGYPNSNHDILTYLTKDTLMSAKWAIPRIIYPDMQKVNSYDTAGRWTMIPNENQIQGRAVFLTDGRAISYAESFMGIVEHYNLTDIIGSPTAGANGNVNSFTTLGGFSITWTGMRVTKHDDSQHHLVGIQPTIPMKPTIEGIRVNKDELLDRAVKVILEDHN